MDYLQDWALKNKIQFNPSEFEELIIFAKASFSHLPFSYYLDGCSHQRVNLKRT